MKDETRNSLISLGMDLDETLARFVGNEGLMFRLLKRFLDDKTFQQLSQAIAEGRTEDAFHAAHTLKGVAGNLGLGGLFDAVSPLVEALRSSGDEPINAMLESVSTQYELVLITLQTLGD